MNPHIQNQIALANMLGAIGGFPTRLCVKCGVTFIQDAHRETMLCYDCADAAACCEAPDVRTMSVRGNAECSMATMRCMNCGKTSEVEV